MTDIAPKNAIILAAGSGSRLRPLTDLRPKPLVEVNGTPIILNALRRLEAVGVESATIVVGYRKDAIQYACGARFGSVRIDYIESSLFDQTGSAYSLWLAREVLLGGDHYLLEGDVFFEQAVLDRFDQSEASAVAAVAPFDARMQGSAVLLSEAGFIYGFRLKQSGADLSRNPALFKTLNLFRFSASTLRATIVPGLDDIIRSGATRSYTEELFAYLIERRGLQLAAARCDHARWWEIDTADDLRIANELFGEQHSTPRHDSPRT
ncbi:hemolysin activation protein [Bradyrhizobium brasilense]|uniref:phosphocholine cytidylyltransferase family protein n=1 Tax=Bradyrhizobium brasilense TaxID=1419277 RepID=UPI0009764082|nr:phosphocholine cytidylyltransferase family protein [Bradyrhizobium brasilense]OMI12962.1 hemolysin activation protein [Bradyrhizobium brasilense]